MGTETGCYIASCCIIKWRPQHSIEWRRRWSGAKFSVRPRTCNTACPCSRRHSVASSPRCVIAESTARSVVKQVYYRGHFPEIWDADRTPLMQSVFSVVPVLTQTTASPSITAPGHLGKGRSRWGSIHLESIKGASNAGITFKSPKITPGTRNSIFGTRLPRQLVDRCWQLCVVGYTSRSYRLLVTLPPNCRLLYRGYTGPQSGSKLTLNAIHRGSANAWYSVAPSA